ncbi:MAG: DUF6531 domain-containing protein [Byssovorax sp.]
MAEVVIHKKYAAHQKSNHAAPGPPAVSGILPGVSAGAPPYTPAPFLYIAKSSAAHSGTCTVKTKKRRTRYLIKGSVMDVEHPANDPSKPLQNTPPNGSDLVSKVACGQAKITTCGQSGVTVGSSLVAVVGADVVLNIPTDTNTVHQSQSKLLDGVGLIAAWNDGSKNPAKVRYSGDPVALATGEVAENLVDLELPGMIILAWSRHYASGRNKERGPFGKGGWRHGYQEWIDDRGGKLVLHLGDGARVELPALAPRAKAFHRGRGLTFTRAVDSYEVTCIHDGRTREFAPVVPGGPPVLELLKDRFGNRIELAYEKGQLRCLTDTAGRQLRISWDPKGLIARAEVWAREEAQQAVDYGYSDDGDLATVTNALAQTDFYTYDARHRLIAKKTRSGVRFQFTYDDERGGRCVQSTGADRLQRINLQYEEAGARVLVSGNPEPHEYTFSDKGDLLREATFDESSALDYEYDDDQLLTSIKNAAGEGTTYERDALGLLVKSTDADGTGVTIDYAEGGLPIRRVDGVAVTTIEWDARPAPIAITYPSGARVTQEFDRFGRLVRKLGPDTSLIAQNVYDDEHNLLAVTDGRGATTRFEVDAMGRTLSETDALGRKATWEYDAIGRPIRHVMRDGTVVELELDAGDNVVRNSDGAGLVTVTERCGTGSVARRTTPDGQTWEMSYDILERLREIKNPKGEIYEFSYDRAGRVIEEKTFDGQSMRYVYSRRDLLARVEFEDETWMEYEHDEAGLHVKTVTPHGTTTFSRDDQGRIVAAVVEEHNGSTTVEVEWDARGQVASLTSNGRKVAYTWDAYERVASRELPNGETTRYHWDPRGALIGVDHAGEKVLLQRDVLGREVRRHVYASGLDLRFGYNADDRLTDQYVTLPSRTAPAQPEVVVRRKWDYGAHARLRALHDTRWGTTSYGHDVLGQLTEAQRGRRVERFAYDPTGSLVAAGVDPDVERWTVRMGNVLTRTPNARYEYDARRRRRRKIDLNDGSETEYLWDCQGQLREVKLPSGERVLFTYDAFGRRARKTVIGPQDADSLDPPRVRVVDYVWDFDELAMEIDSERGERVFVHEPSTFVPLLQRVGGETFAVVTDRLGVPRELIDGQGRVAWSAAFSAWGKLTDVVLDESREAAAATPFRLLGQYADDETGLAYTRYRYFDPDTARWLSPDPLRLHGRSLNLFAFDGSPTERADRLGLYTRAEFKAFLEKYEDKRKAAMAAVDANQTGFSARTVAANDKGDTAYNGGERDKARSPYGTNRGNDPNVHAEEKLLTPGGNQAMGADKPHCPNCTNDIIGSNNVPATSIHPDWKPRDAQLQGPVDTKDPNAQANW